MNTGSSNRQIYDNCNYQKNVYESTSPLLYMTYFGSVENVNRCNYDKFWTRYQLVDIESELRNQTRPLSKCDQFKYTPNCPKSGMCVSTFSKDVPVVLAPEVCPIVFNNIPVYTDPGFRMNSNKF